MRKKRYLTIEEKRDWLASVFRDESGEFSQADKFKAMTEDTKLAVLQTGREAPQSAGNTGTCTASLFDQLPPPLGR